MQANVGSVPTPVRNDLERVTDGFATPYDETIPAEFSCDLEAEVS